MNLAPADIKKEGSHFDLAIALGILQASEQIENVIPNTCYYAGELSLDGSLRPVPGILPMALELMKCAPENSFIVPIDNSQEAGLVNEVKSFSASSLQEVCADLQGTTCLSLIKPTDYQSGSFRDGVLDFSDVRGQEAAKRALLITAAGLHNLLLIGPPGSGKTMLARRVPGIMPEMNREEVLETTRI